MDLELTFAQPAAVDEHGRRIRGVVVPYGIASAPTSNGARYRFHRPPVNAEDLVDLVREHDEDAVVGRLDAWEHAVDHLAASVRPFSTTAGNDALIEATEKVRTGFSIGADATDPVLAADGVYDVGDWTARHIGLVRRPAFADSTITSVAASQAPPDKDEDQDEDKDDEQDTTEDTEDTTEGLEDDDQEDDDVTIQTSTPPVELARRSTRRADLTFAQVRDTLADAIRRSPDAAFVNAALMDVIPSADGGGGLLPPQWLGELWTPVAARRDYINSIQRATLTSGTKVYGWRWLTTPVVGPYAGNKTPIPSNAVTTEPVEEPISRLAGGWDVDRIFVDLGDPGFLEAFFQAATRDYALKTEALVSSKLQANATDATATDLLGALGVIAQSLSSVGATPGFVGVASDLWGDFLALTADQAPFWLASNSNVSLSGSEGTVSGLRFFVDPNLPAGHVLGGDSNAATYYEAQPAPLRIQAVNIPNGGIDIAVAGYQAVLVNDLRGIINVTVGGVAADSSARGSKK